MNSIITTVPITFHRLCWFCQGKCNNFISICSSCEDDIKNRKNKKNIHKKIEKKLGYV
jgi:hypothetical protein